MKDEKFIENFINLYIEKIDLEFNLLNDNVVKYKKELNEINKKIKSSLPKYSLLFEDINLLYTLFNKVVEEKKKKKYVFNDKFDFFLEWIFKELYRIKAVSKKEFNHLNEWLSRFNIEPRRSGPGEIGGLCV